jgi:hypothetical protein
VALRLRCLCSTPRSSTGIDAGFQIVASKVEELRVKHRAPLLWTKSAGCLDPAITVEDQVSEPR